MTPFWKRVEKATNILAIVAFVTVLGAFIAKRYSTIDAPRIGGTFPALNGFNWSANAKTLVLVLQTGCHYCEESMPFYRSLNSAEAASNASIGMVAVFPNSANDASLSLAKEHLPVVTIANISTASIKVSGTPTLILLDRDRRVQNTWIGKLDEAGQKSVYSALGLQMAPSVAAQCDDPRAGACQARCGGSDLTLCVDQQALSTANKVAPTNVRP